MLVFEGIFFGKSGKCLNRTQLSEVTKVPGGWLPMKIICQMMLKNGNGTPVHNRIYNITRNKQPAN